jgi:hypothetical protein
MNDLKRIRPAGWVAGLLLAVASGAVMAGPYGPVRFHGGWYGPWHGRMVVRPAIGFYVPVLPPFYSTLWFGGVPYYYVDDTYYLWDPGRRVYVVTRPPKGASAEAATAGENLFVYPKNGQNEAQIAKDRFDCHAWAREQTGFDPVDPKASGPAGRAAAGVEYRRAEQACLEGRGYTAR